jgi:GxGYxYP putative glycoside hydrolase C-terminal domain/GxGYxY sequence motif in domain of unknown function N-terminal
MQKKIVNLLLKNCAVWLAGVVLSGSPALPAQLPQLWPTFSQPTTVVSVNTYGTIASTNDELAEATLAGAYNQLQGSTRLYMNSDYVDSGWWLTQSIPSGVTVSNLSWNQSDPDGALKAMLTAYGSSIAGYIICDPTNAPETCNMATTMAGIHDAMVVTPNNLTVMAGYPSIPLISGGDLRTYLWVGSNSTLVNNTTINTVNNPSGGSGTTGWTHNCSTGQTLGTATYLGVTALEWTSTANQGNCWARFYPSVTLGKFYVFSVQVAGSGTVFLDAWDGTLDHQSGSVTLNSTGWQTLQVTIPVPNSDNSNPVMIQVRANTTSNPVTAYFINAAVVGQDVAIDTYQYNNLIGSTSTSALALLDYNTTDALRDYAVAAKLFTYYLSSANADEATLFENVLGHTAHDTPVLGWVQNEGADVTTLSESGYGHFLNASNTYMNGSVWASFPGPSSYTQPATAPIKTTNGTVYVAFAMSDGDNIGFDQHRDQNDWTTSQFLGAVPAAWTTSPGLINFSPGILNYDYQFLPQSNEMMAGPGGVGYETNMTGSDFTTFESDTKQFLTSEDMSTVTSWHSTESDMPGFATNVDVPHVVWRNAYPYAQESDSANTVLDGQVISYNDTPAQNISAIESYVSSNWSSGAPLFVEALADNATLTPDDVLYIAQQLQTNGGHPYVFMTPSAMALTEAAYHNGTCSSCPTSNAQAVPGSTIVASFPNNLVNNASGANAIRLNGNFALGTTGHQESLFGGNFRVGVANAGTNVYAYSTMTVPLVNAYYFVSIQVTGVGIVELGMYDGSTTHYSSPVTLSSSPQTISMLTQIKSLTAGQVQVVFPNQSTTADVTFTINNIQLADWYYVVGGATGFVNLSAATYNYQPAMLLTIPANYGIGEIVYQPVASMKTSTAYNFSVDVAGSGQANMQIYNGGGYNTTSTITLGSSYQTLSLQATTASSFSSTPQFRVQAPQQTGAVSIYFRNPTVTLVSGTTDFYTGLETGQPQLTWTNTVDTTSPGGGESNVTSTVLDSSTSLTHGGTDTIAYSGTANGGSTDHAYMEAFSNSTTLSSTSRLSYWIYPMSPRGAEPGASSTTALNSTCAAVDIIFTNGTALRNDTSVTDQYGNQMNPAHMCNHLQPDQWNYVTTNLSSLSGLTISRIDIGYDQPGGSGDYSGYVDDITLSH